MFSVSMTSPIPCAQRSITPSFPAEAVCAAEIWELLTSDTDKRRPSLQDAQDETEEVLFDIVGKLLKRTNTKPTEV